MEGLIRVGRSLSETPTWSVATVTTVMVFVCLLVQRSIYRFGKANLVADFLDSLVWLKKTRRKALFASLEKIKEGHCLSRADALPVMPEKLLYRDLVISHEIDIYGTELMLLGLISLLLGQWARVISQICVDSSLFSTKFFICSEEDYGMVDAFSITKLFSLNETDIPPKGISNPSSHQCGEGREPFVSYQGLEQLHRFLFVLGMTHVLYSCIAVGLAMSKVYSWGKWETQASILSDGNLQAKKNKVMRRQSTFILHHASHPWSRSRVLIWMLCFLRQFRSSIQKSDYFALRLGFITNHQLPLSYNFHNYIVRSMEDEFYGMVGISWPLWGYAILCIFINIHGLNIYFWLSFIPAILVMLVGTKLQHVVSVLALEIVEPRGPSTATQVKPRDDLFWFGKPEILLRLIQFISFQNAFEMATFIWSLWGFKQRSCFMKNHMGSRCKKALIAESVRESLILGEKSRRDALHSITTRSICSLGSTIDEGDEVITVASGTLSHALPVAH
ncbi:hypothetical protein RJ639_007311 [Escallonia herrerae]|uniref:MLO-like protein n=1 Tax=Escallonia herrerae TaxID=1293975 RepID=A0AA88VVN1_9ASTE|nr:hypothetical protein RJ639_007311 [Escallonia herrerae]